jgi:D-amino peptidase
MIHGRAAAGSRHARPAPYVPASPVTFTVELARPDQAPHYEGRTDVELLGPRRVVSRRQTFWQAWDQFWYRLAP